jgi:hypothetical protein
MYLIQGSTKDFNYGCLGSVAWSVEISLDKQPAGPNIEYYYTINKSGMLALIEHSGYGIEGTVTDAVTGLPVKASVWVGNNYPTFTDGGAGDYHKYMVAGTYNLRFTANGYQPLEVNGVTVSALQSTVTDVQLQPMQSQYGYRTCMSRIPGFSAQNPGDEGYSAACLGAPDQLNYSLGKGGYIILDLQKPILDEPGPDLTVYEGDASPEGYAVYALTNMDGYWNYLGSGTGTASFDLSVAGIPQAQYFAVLDDNNGTANVNDAGFDLDAIANIHAPIPDTLAHLSGTVYDESTGLPMTGALVSLADTILVTDTSGYFSADALRGATVICASYTNYNTRCDTVLLLPGAAGTHDFYLNFNVGLNDLTLEHSFTVIPNPFTDRLTISFNNEMAGRVRIYLTPLTGSGIILLKDAVYPSGSHTFSGFPASVSADRLSPGIYILNIETNKYKQRSKVIKL